MALTLLVRACREIAAGDACADQAEKRERGAYADLRSVGLAHIGDRELPDRHAEHLVEGVHRHSPESRLRTWWAMRLWSDHSSMKPGLDCWLKRPPDSPKPASAASYSACGDERVMTAALPL